MATKFYEFDPVDFITGTDDCLYLLNDALQTKDLKFILKTLGVIARYKGMTQLAKDTNTNRGHLYKMLSEEGNPSAQNLLQIIDSLGLKLSVSAK